MKLKKLATATALTLAAVFGTGNALAVVITPTVTYTPGTTLNTTGISNLHTSGADMAGMNVTAYFSNATSETAVWDAGLGTAGAATGTGWSVGFAGSTTFDPFWEVLNNTNVSMVRLVIDGQPGSTVFDTIQSSEYTPGSALGKAFSAVNGPAELSVSANYLNQVARNGTVWGDLFAVLDIGFSSTGAAASGGLSGRLTFTADTDNTAVQGDLNPIPEPATLALLGLGLLGLGFTRLRA